MTALESVERIEVSPELLIADLNIRQQLQLDKDFLASIKERGVLVPIKAVRTAEGGLRVRFGHRRTAAAIQAGLQFVPVEIVGAEEIGDAGEVDRIVDQYAENEFRAALTNAERVSVVQQLMDLGVKQKDITRHIKLKKQAVVAAVSIGQSAVASRAVERYEFLSFEQGSALAEFEDDKDAVKTLVFAANAGGFDHTLAKLREEREDRIALEEAKADLEASGIRYVDRSALTNDTRKLDRLTQDGESITEEVHGSCPGHAAWLDGTWLHPDGDDVDEDDDGWRIAYRPVFVCMTPDIYGHVDACASQRSMKRGATDAGNDDPSRAEAERQERSRVLKNNKAWRAAEVVRREWLKNFVGRKTAPKDALGFIVHCMAAGDWALSDAMGKGHRYGGELLGVEMNGSRYGDASPLVAALNAAPAGRISMMGLAIVLGALESATGVHTWRGSMPANQRYFAALQRWGYELSDVEQLALPDGESE